jgi:hypothetical protein
MLRIVVKVGQTLQIGASTTIHVGERRGQSVQLNIESEAYPIRTLKPGEPPAGRETRRPAGPRTPDPVPPQRVSWGLSGTPVPA